MESKTVNPERIRKVAQSVIGLPTLPTVISKMLQMIDSKRASADTLARLISTDQALTAKLLKLANSAYYGYSREISTVNMAIIVLGFNTVKDMGLWLSVFDAFKNSNSGAVGFDAVKFWEHSAGCGVASRMLAKNTGSRYAGEAFVAGLLHDMGKMILNQYFAPEMAESLKLAQEAEMDIDAAEMEVLGVSHGQIGAWLAEKWNLPDIICDTVKHHHDPWNASSDPAFVAHITVADTLCHLTQTGDSARNAPPKYDERLWNIFADALVPIDEIDLESLQSDFLVEYGKSEAYSSVIKTDGLNGIM
ncbi:MAG: HDOD domain-containing protein [Chitinispirillia bacterium]|nr:HDOD domain-containing protein [Chitinispirillia bacterium]MCL2268623.1 HDOD domain-containing protein [Chitinispirillia bacterium]